MRLRYLFALAVSLALGFSPARADVLYTSFGPGDTYLGSAVQFIGVYDWETPIRTDFRVANQFQVATAANASLYRVAISLRTGMPSNSETGYLSLWSGGATPTDLIEEMLFDTAGPTPGMAFIATVASASHPTLSPGETYWVVLRAGDGWTDTYRWYDATDPTGLTRYASWTGHDWDSVGTRGNAFEVQGVNAVPEPATWISLAAVASLVVYARMRRRR